ncbi:MAG: hypothetical protein ABI689_13300 [Thermoanaerobaculia bacterium]
MSRFRIPCVATILALFLLTALPAASWGLRNADQGSAALSTESWGSHLLGAISGWGQAAFSWFQALIAAEHGHIVDAPVVPPTTPWPL